MFDDIRQNMGRGEVLEGADFARVVGAVVEDFDQRVLRGQAKKKNGSLRPDVIVSKSSSLIAFFAA